ncbi:MAG: chemotaxis protein CheB [Planctomycetes bacterium]|nr:chemotaxis protein CheB [Planctomycetota bacterium]
MAQRDIVAIGSSYGGVQTLAALVAGIPKDLPASILIVQHLPSERKSYLSDILSNAGSLPAIDAHEGAEICPGMIFVAPANNHLSVKSGRIQIDQGPRENGFRPAIDVLFRSVALEYGPRAIGIVLSGHLDDGTAGLFAIKREGGLAVVQDPKDALSSDMPLSALEHVAVDHVVPVSEMGRLLVQLVREHVPEVSMGTKESQPLREVTKPAEMADRGPPSPFTCPECGGSLWESTGDGVLQFRCHVGHVYSEESLVEQQWDSVERALWAALRALKEKAAVALRILRRAEQQGETEAQGRLLEKYQEADQQAEMIREMLLNRRPKQRGLTA